MALTKVTSGIRTLATDEVTTDIIEDGTVTNAKIKSDAAIEASKLESTLDLSGKTVTLPAASVTAHVTQFDDNQLKEEIALLGFRTAANGSLAKYNLVDQTIDVFEDASGIDASASIDEIRNSAKYYSGAVIAPTGGTITTYTDGGTDYIVHSFLSDGDFITSADGNADYLIVAGGGGAGGYALPGAGGAGGLLTAAALSTTAQTYAIVVGDGGAGDNSSDGTGTNGVNSTGFGLTAIGGGGGASGVYGDANSGGSGGGGNGYGTGSGGQPGTVDQGYAGSDGQAYPDYGGGGGGGAGAASVTNPSAGYGAVGGIGLQNSYRTGSAVYYGGGGGGSGRISAPGGAGGLGGGGAGSDNSTTPTAGTANTGGGGGAGGAGVGAAGGSGIVVIRFVDGVLNPKNDITLISNASTAEAVPTKGDLVMTYTNGAGTTTVNTDLKAYASRDDGTTWTQLTLASQGSTGAHTILSAHDLDISGQPSGTDMRYKITTHNQSAAKETRIQAVSLGWS
jgi:hypothetical protein